MGVTLSVTSLVMTLAQDNPDQYKGSYVKAAQRLKKIVVDGDIAPDYLYYKVPCPWVQVKFLRLLQYFPPSGEQIQRSILSSQLTYRQCRGYACPRFDSGIFAADPARGNDDAEKCTAKQCTKCGPL